MKTIKLGNNFSRNEIYNSDNWDCDTNESATEALGDATVDRLEGMVRARYREDAVVLPSLQVIETDDDSAIDPDDVDAMLYEAFDWSRENLDEIIDCAYILDNSEWDNE